MKSVPKLCLTIILFLSISVYLLMYVQIPNREGIVTGWDSNTTRIISHYLSETNFTAHLFPTDFCDRKSLLIVIVCSSPTNEKARIAIRETWGSIKTFGDKNISIYYLLGQTDNTTLQNEIVDENDRYGDIIQEHFVDSYNNLTLKSVAMLKLIDHYCANTTDYLLKIDDDMFVNMPYLVDMLKARKSSKNLLTGKLICRARPIKDINSKWYSPNYMYAGKIYPNYLSGTGYLLSVDVVQKLYKTALETPIFHLEDVFITGICAKKLNIRPRNNPLFTYHKWNINSCILNKLITAHHFTPESIRHTYNMLGNYSLMNECNESKPSFSVNEWMMNNIFMLNKTHRRSKCD